MKRRQFSQDVTAGLGSLMVVPLTSFLGRFEKLSGEPGELYRWTATELAGLIRTKAVSVTEVVRAHLERARLINPQINALTTILEKSALEMAARHDQLLAGGAVPGALFGIPFSVKENIDLAGWPTTDGVAGFQNNFPQVDAPQITAFKAKGAIPLARGNMPDFALRYHTDSGLKGATLNPWDTTRTPGGSSGGDAAAVATGMVTIGLGNDYGGSLRFPAQCNGICSLRPSRGRVPYFSASIPGNALPHSVRMFAVQGPLARSVSDLSLSLECMSQRDARDPHWVPAPLDFPAKPALKAAVITNPGGFGADSGIVATVELAADMLKDGGITVEQVDSASVIECLELWGQVVTTDVRHVFMDVLESHASVDAMRFVQLFLELYPPVSVDHYVRILSRINGMASAWGGFFEQYDAVIGPISARQPFRVGWDIESADSARKMLESQALTVTANLLGLPAVTVPVGLDNGLPQSVQIIGPPFYEQRCLQLAQMLETAAGRFTPVM